MESTGGVFAQQWGQLADADGHAANAWAVTSVYDPTDGDTTIASLVPDAVSADVDPIPGTLAWDDADKVTRFVPDGSSTVDASDESDITGWVIDDTDDDLLYSVLLYAEGSEAGTVGTTFSPVDGIVATTRPPGASLTDRVTALEARTVAGVSAASGDYPAAALAAALAIEAGGGSSGSVAIDLSGETPGAIDLDLSTGTYEVAASVSAVNVELPDFVDNTLTVTVPDGSTRGPLILSAFTASGDKRIEVIAGGQRVTAASVTMTLSPIESTMFASSVLETWSPWLLLLPAPGSGAGWLDTLAVAGVAGLSVRRSTLGRIEMAGSAYYGDGAGAPDTPTLDAFNRSLVVDTGDIPAWAYPSLDTVQIGTQSSEIGGSPAPPPLARGVFITGTVQVQIAAGQNLIQMYAIYQGADLT